MILSRYLTREILSTMAAVIVVLLLIFMGQSFSHFLSWAAEGFISNTIVLDMLLLRTLNAFEIMLPFGLYLSVLIAFGRLYKDNEMTALAASGVGLSVVLRPVIALSLVFTFVVGMLSFYVSPLTQEKVLQLREQTEATAEFEGIAAGQFARMKSRDNSVFYTESLSDDRQEMRNVFVQMREEESLVIYSASKGYQTVDEKSGERFFVLLDGYRYQVVPGEGGVKMQHYQKSAFRMDEKDVVARKREEGERPTVQLFRSDSPDDIAELQWRFALPISALLLPLLAVLLSRTSPRQGRFGKLFLSILIFVIYNNALSVSRTWVETEQIPAYIGLWWVQVVLVIMIVFLYLRQSGWRWRREAWRVKTAAIPVSEG